MKKNGMLITITFVLAVVLASCGGSGSSGNSPAKTVDNFFDYVLSKNYDKASELFIMKDGTELSDADKQKVKALLMAGEENAAEKDGFKKVEIIEEKVNEDGISGKVTFKIIFGNGDEDQQDYSVKKVDGKWMIIVN